MTGSHYRHGIAKKKMVLRKYTHAHTHTHTYTRSVCGMLVPQEQVLAHKHIHTQTHTHTNTYTHKHAQTHTHTNTYTHKHIHQTHTHTNTYTKHIHTQTHTPGVCVVCPYHKSKFSLEDGKCKVWSESILGIKGTEACVLKS